MRNRMELFMKSNLKQIIDLITKNIEEKYPDLEIDSHKGNQPLYPVIFSLE